jgi:hypothetical protein
VADGRHTIAVRAGAFVTTTVERSEHVGERPTWDCRACGRPWPCADARRQLRDEFRRFPSFLSIYMSAQMMDAVGDLTASGGQPPADLYERFLLWIRSAVG